MTYYDPIDPMILLWSYWSYGPIMMTLLILWSYSDPIDPLILLWSYWSYSYYDPTDPLILHWSDDPVTILLLLWSSYDPGGSNDPMILWGSCWSYDPMVLWRWRANRWRNTEVHKHKRNITRRKQLQQPHTLILISTDWRAHNAHAKTERTSQKQFLLNPRL